MAVDDEDHNLLGLKNQVKVANRKFKNLEVITCKDG
jgi:hypothetical protein